MLKGLTESSKCPECGKPLVEVLTRPQHAAMNFGKRYRSRATLFGWPVVDVAIGPKDGQFRGRAKGIIAIGDVATGAVAIGGIARGIVAVGGFAIGAFSLGGGAVGLITATGGGAVGGMAAGGGALGILAAGGGAVGAVAQGGGALGLFTRDARGLSPGAADAFSLLSWFFSPSLTSPAAVWQPMLVTGLLSVVVGALIGLFAWLRFLRHER